MKEKITPIYVERIQKGPYPSDQDEYHIVFRSGMHHYTSKRCGICCVGEIYVPDDNDNDNDEKYFTITFQETDKWE
jgi:hypothetical protein